MYGKGIGPQGLSGPMNNGYTIGKGKSASGDCGCSHSPAKKLKDLKVSPLKLKDACYKKVKASYDVFPSAYASGAIAKCRKNK
jgi:hypothetical protein